MNTRSKVLVSSVIAILILVSTGIIVFTTQSENDQQNNNDPTEKCLYNACPKLHPTKLNVHVIPHSHDDAGFLKTVDTYYTDQVKYISDFH